MYPGHFQLLLMFGIHNNQSTKKMPASNNYCCINDFVNVRTGNTINFVDAGA